MLLNDNTSLIFHSVMTRAYFDGVNGLRNIIILAKKRFDVFFEFGRKIIDSPACDVPCSDEHLDMWLDDAVYRSRRNGAIPMRVWRRHSAMLSILEARQSQQSDLQVGHVENAERGGVVRSQHGRFQVLSVTKLPVWASAYHEMGLLARQIHSRD